MDCNVTMLWKQAYLKGMDTTGKPQPSKAFIMRKWKYGDYHIAAIVLLWKLLLNCNYN